MANIPLPDFFIVGAAKAGTTSIYQYLKQHPEIYLPPIKEVNFFCTDIQIKNFRPDYAGSVFTDVDAWIASGMKTELFHGFLQHWNQYEKIFQQAEGKKAIGELSNTYLFSEVAAKNIVEKFPEAKIIMVLRHPVERAFSHYLMDFKNGLVNENFLIEFNRDKNKEKKGWGISNLYFELGLYSEQVKRYIDLFSNDRIKIFLFDDLVNDERAVFKTICNFLNIDSGFQFDFETKHNQNTFPKNKWVAAISKQKFIRQFIKNIIPDKIKNRIKKTAFSSKNVPKLSEEDRTTVTALYKDDVLKLAELIRRDLNHWLK